MKRAEVRLGPGQPCLTTGEIKAAMARNNCIFIEWGQSQRRTEWQTFSRRVTRFFRARIKHAAWIRFLRRTLFRVYCQWLWWVQRYRFYRRQRVTRSLCRQLNDCRSPEERKIFRITNVIGTSSRKGDWRRLLCSFTSVRSSGYSARKVLVKLIWPSTFRRFFGALPRVVFPAGTCCVRDISSLDSRSAMILGPVTRLEMLNRVASVHANHGETS